MLLTIEYILSWAETTNSARNFLEGNRIIYANHITSIGVKNDSSDECHVFATCIQTSHPKDPCHDIEGRFKKINGEILSVKCSCKAGLGEKCKHILGFLIYCSR